MSGFDWKRAVARCALRARVRCTSARRAWSLRIARVFGAGDAAPFALRAARVVVRSLAMFALASGSASAKVDAGQFAGTYRAVGGNAPLQVRVQADGAVEFFVPGDGRRMRGIGLFNAIGQAGFTGVTADGEAFGIGLVRGARALSVGAGVFALESIAAAEFGRASVAAPVQPAQGGGGGALAGLRLTTASSRNGYSRLRSFDFCGDGRVFSRFEELQSSQFGNAAGAREDGGTWHLNGNVLEMQLARGGFVRATLQQVAADVVAVDGTRYAVERSRRCR